MFDHDIECTRITCKTSPPEYRRLLRDRIRPWSILKRVVALAVALCVAAGPLEAWIPDAHDGDAHSVVVTAAVSGVDAPVVTSAPASAGDMGTSVPASPDGHHSTPTHDVHVDHCSHSHLVAVTNATPARKPDTVDRQRAQSAERMLVSVARTPGLRPPIA